MVYFFILKRFTRFSQQRERVNRFTDIFRSMLTKILSCGIIKNDKKARLSEGK